MKKMFICVLMLLCIEEASSQTSLDMVVLRNRHNRTIKSYFAGIPITFGDQAGNVTQGVIKKVAGDSLFILQYDIRQAATMWGTPVLDTVSTYFIKFHTNEIAWIKKPRQSFEPFRNGTVFLLGGLGYGILHVANAAYLGEPVLWPNLAVAGGAAGLGYLMKKLRTNQYKIGKKYKLVYIDATPKR